MWVFVALILDIRWFLQIYFILSIGVEGAIIYQFYSASRPTYSATGELLDGGHDLNQEGGINEYVPYVFFIFFLVYTINVYLYSVKAWDGTFM